MRNRLTTCSVLLIAAIFFLMLQVSLALHHHHTYSYHDDQDCFHAAPTTLDKLVDSNDAEIGFLAQYLLYCPLVTATLHLFQGSCDVVTFETPADSRAPPTGTPDDFCVVQDRCLIVEPIAV